MSGALSLSRPVFLINLRIIDGRRRGVLARGVDTHSPILPANRRDNYCKSDWLAPIKLFFARPVGMGRFTHTASSQPHWR